MKYFVLAFFLMVQFAPAMDKEQIISGFIDAVRKYDVVQYNVDYTLTDESQGADKHNYQIAEKNVPTDTSAGCFYNVKEVESQNIYCGSEFLEYMPGYYGPRIVKFYNRKKDPKTFTGYEVEVGGIKGYYLGIVKHNLMFEKLIFPLAQKFSKKYLSKESITTKDSLINGQDCYILRISGTEFYAFDKINFMPLYYYCNYQVQWHEVFYSDYKFNQGDSKILFSRRAFPKNYKFKPDPSPLKLKELPIGKEVPNWELTTINDKKINTLDLRGKPLLLIFSEIGCLPCLASIPELNEIANTHKEINVLAIYPLDSKEAMLKYAKEKKFTYDILCNARETAKSYCVGGYPTFFLIDGNGILRYSDAGWGPRMKKEIEKKIEKVIRNN